MNASPLKASNKKPKRREFSKLQIQTLYLLHRFFDAIQTGQLSAFLKSDQIRKWLRQGGASAGIQLGDGTPGSKLPELGSNPLDILRGIFNTLDFGLSDTDHSHGVDPAAGRTTHDDGNGNHTTVVSDSHGNISVVTTHADGSIDDFDYRANGSSAGSRTDGNGRIEYWILRPDGHGGYTETRGVAVHYGPHGLPTPTPHLPGEDGGEENTERNPLSGINVLGPQSLRQMVLQKHDPANDLKGLDPNTGIPGFTLTKDDQRHLGSTAPALEVLDINDGSNPLTQLHIDPNQVHTRSEKDNVVDPNTGQKPLPVPKG